MSNVPHYMIIGNGAAGNEAAWHLRRRDPHSRITLITAGRLLFLSRYEFPKVFEGLDDWRDLLVHPPEYYLDQRISVRRNTLVNHVEPGQRTLYLQHKEQVAYDKLLVASGGGGYLPEDLREYRHLLHNFGTFRQAVEMRQALPATGGKVVMLGGDMKGLELARHLVGAGHEVMLVPTDQLFAPHEVSADDRPRFVRAVEQMGLRVIPNRKVARIEEGARGMPARRVVFEDGDDLRADVVTAFCGLMPALGFMMKTGVDIERGLLVNPQLRTVDEHIWAAGDVCQIWSPEEKQYRFYYGWNNVKMMGRIAAINMTGGNEVISTFQKDEPFINEREEIDSPFWNYN